MPTPVITPTKQAEIEPERPWTLSSYRTAPSLPETDLCESGHHGRIFALLIVHLFEFRRWHIADSLQESAVELGDPFEGCELDRFEVTPRAALTNHLGLVQAGLGQGILVGIPDAAHRRLDPGLNHALGVTDRQLRSLRCTRAPSGPSARS